ncbi:MAG: hypothetical protein HY978_04315 [Candidatus Liptonbacteria bacterium]|nr:hypothetical protein [Candidatus Liptonbacteria bacterium]
MNLTEKGANNPIAGEGFIVTTRDCEFLGEIFSQSFTAEEVAHRIELERTHLRQAEIKRGLERSRRRFLSLMKRWGVALGQLAPLHAEGKTQHLMGLLRGGEADQRRAKLWLNDKNHADGYFAEEKNTAFLLAGPDFLKHYGKPWQLERLYLHERFHGAGHPGTERGFGGGVVEEGWVEYLAKKYSVHGETEELERDMREMGDSMRGENFDFLGYNTDLLETIMRHGNLSEQDLILAFFHGQTAPLRERLNRTFGPGSASVLMEDGLPLKQRAYLPTGKMNELVYSR